MTPAFTARKRAEEFAALIEQSSTSGLHDARYAEFLEIVTALREAPAPQARPEFVAQLRERLLTAAATQLVPSEDDRLTLPTRRPTRDRRIAAAISGVALVAASTSMAMAAQSALPGDVLYPLKRAIENAQTGFSVDQGAKGESLLANASGRLDEVSALTRQGRLEDGSAIASTLNTFTEQATEASDLLLDDYASTGHEGSISELRDFTAASMQTIGELEGLVPVEARDELLHAARVLAQIDEEAAQACPHCGGDGITQIPAILTSGGFAGGAGATSVTAEQTQGVGGKDTSKPGPELPEADDGPLSPGSVLNPSAPDDGSGTSDDQGTTNDPIGDLAEGLTDGGGSSQPTSGSPSLPGLPDLGDSVDGLGDVTDPLTGDPTP